jgi:phage recombination protein Bet
VTDTLVPAANGGQLTSSQILSGLNTVRDVLAPDLSPDELKLFAMVAARSGLDPFAKQIYAVKRKGRVTFQTGIDGYRSIAARTGLYDGQDEPEFGPVCECGDKRPDGHPEYAVVRVYRKGVGRAIAGRADWHEFKPEAGERGTGDVMWTRMPRVMLSKVAEALALRKAFPYDPERREGIGADLYTADEMAQADRPERVPEPRQTAAERLSQRRAAIEAPATIQEPVADVDGAVVPEPVTNGFCGAESPLDGAKCGIAADVNHSIHREIRDGKAVQTWPAGN